MIPSQEFQRRRDTPHTSRDNQPFDDPFDDPFDAHTPPSVKFVVVCLIAAVSALIVSVAMALAYA